MSDERLAAAVSAAALTEVGYLTRPSSAISTNVPPIIAWKAWCLGMIAVGRTPCPFDEWPAWMIEHHARSPWVDYFEMHGVTP